MMRCLFCFLASALSVAPTPDREAGSSAHLAFNDFKAQFGRIYEDAEDGKRFAIFQANVEKIKAYNSQNLSYKMGVTRFSDLTVEEFLAQTAGEMNVATPPDAPIRSPVSGTNLPDAVDWIARGAVTPVKDQGGCGACWAFATTGALEGAYFLASGHLVSLSEQDFVSCFGKTCIAGSAWEALRWAKDHAICTEASYPYGPYPGDKPLPPISACKNSSCDVALPAGTVAGFEWIATKNESALIDAVSQQPVAVSVDASCLSQYSSGIISGCCAQYRTDHAVLVVGYGSEGGIDYWKVKNSFGSKFGENGYFRVQRHDKACSSYQTGGMGILTGPVVPIVPKQLQTLV